jgi:hypothetical protein
MAGSGCKYKIPGLILSRRFEKQQLIRYWKLDPAALNYTAAIQPGVKMESEFHKFIYTYS